MMQYSPAHDVVVYKTENPLRLLAVTEGGRKINGEHVALPATVSNLQALRKLDLPVIAPLEKDGYDWPIRAPWKPLPHQKVTANFLALNPRSFCLNDMGTMKTLSALWAADYLMEMERRKGLAFRALVVCPLSITRSVWADAIFQNFIGRRKAVVLTGSAARRRRLLSEDADFYIINFDGLGVGAPSEKRKPFEGLALDLSERADIRLAIVDEASAYRDSTTRRHFIARKLIGAREYLWMMTGTPTPNGPCDAYGLAKLVNDAHGESFRNYKARIMVSVGPFKWIAKSGAGEAARKLLQPAIRYSIEDCVELPPCTVQRRDADLSMEQEKAFKALKQECVLMVKSGQPITAVNQAVLRMKLIQISCGEIYDADHKSHALDCAPRLAVLDEVIECCSEKVIIFAPLTNVLNMLYNKLSAKHDCALVNGNVPLAERTEIFRGFQKGSTPRIIIADPGTMAHGLTLTAASTVVWYAPTDKTEVYLQANKRIDRPGQTKTTSIVQIAGTDIEREIYKRLEANESMQGVILKLAEQKA